MEQTDFPGSRQRSVGSQRDAGAVFSTLRCKRRWPTWLFFAPTKRPSSLARPCLQTAATRPLK